MEELIHGETWKFTVPSTKVLLHLSFPSAMQRHVEDNNQGNIRSDKKATKERKIEEQNTEWRIALIYNGTNYVSHICTYYFLLRFWFMVLSS